MHTWEASVSFSTAGTDRSTGRIGTCCIHGRWRQRAIRLACALLLLLANSAFASNLLHREDLSPDRFPTAAQRIQGLLVPEAVHGDLAASQKTLVLQRLNRIQRQLDRPLSNPRQQELALERHLVSVNEILATSRTAANSEVYCRRQKSTGSNRVQVVCYDRDEVEEKIAESRNSFREMQCAYTEGPGNLQQGGTTCSR